MIGYHLTIPLVRSRKRGAPTLDLPFNRSGELGVCIQ
jgi:hypothetical protein